MGKHFFAREDIFCHRHKFKDYGVIDWKAVIPVADRDRTLVVLDDHQACTKRVRQTLDNGFVHIFEDDNDNYLYGGPMGDHYSFNMVCSPLPDDANSVIFKDEFGKVTRNITVDEHRSNLRYLWSHIETYFEFPPI